MASVTIILQLNRRPQYLFGSRMLDEFSTYFTRLRVMFHAGSGNDLLIGAGQSCTD